MQPGADALFSRTGHGGGASRSELVVGWCGPSCWAGARGFLDPQGHPWEVARSSSWTVTGDGRTLLEPTGG